MAIRTNYLLTNPGSDVAGYWKFDDNFDFELDYFEYADDTALDAVYHNDTKTALEGSLVKQSGSSLKITCDWYTGGTQRRITVDNSNTRWGPYDFNTLGVGSVSFWVYIPNANLIGEAGTNRFTYYLHTADNINHGGEGWYRQDTAVVDGWNYIESDFSSDYSEESSPNAQFINGVRWSPFKNYPRSDLSGVGRWKLDSDGDDSWNSHNVDTVVGDASYNGSALEVDGNDVVLVPHDNIFNFTGSPMSVSFWFYLRSPQFASFNRIISKEESTVSGRNGWTIMHYTSGPKIGMEFWNGGNRFGSDHLKSTKTDWVDNTWYHIVFTYNGNTTGSVYVDGIPDNNVFDGTFSFVGSNPGNLRFGADEDTGYAGFNGQIDEITIWDKELSQKEVTQINNFGRTNYDTYVVVDAFRAKRSEVAQDSGVYGNNGSVTRAISNVGSTNLGSALEFFNGNSEKIDLPTTIAGSFSNSKDYTWALWIKKDPTHTTAYEAIINMRANHSGNIHRIQMDTTLSTNKVRCRADTETEVNQTMEAVDLSDNAWHHVVLTHDAATKTYTFYNDGVQGNTLTLTGDMDLSSDITHSRIGTGTSIGFKGMIDEVSMWNRALSQDDINNLYLLGSDNPLGPPSDPSLHRVRDEPLSPLVSVTVDEPLVPTMSLVVDEPLKPKVVVSEDEPKKPTLRKAQDRG